MEDNTKISPHNGEKKITNIIKLIHLCRHNELILDAENNYPQCQNRSYKELSNQAKLDFHHFMMRSSKLSSQVTLKLTIDERNSPSSSWACKYIFAAVRLTSKFLSKS